MTHWISHPVSKLQGELTVPGDKSISHRALFLGSLAIGRTTIHGCSMGDDCMRTWSAFEALGVSIERQNDGSITIDGVGKYGLQSPKTALDCGNSGTTMRFLMGLLAAQPFESVLIGDQSLQRRPMERVRIPLMKMGANITTKEGCAPILIQPSSGLCGIDYVMPQASAQVKTALLLAGLYAKGHTHVIETSPTRDHTERMFTTFSCALEKKDQSIMIDSTSALYAGDVHVPGDMSSAAFFIVAATLIPDSDILLRCVNINPTRVGMIHILQKMGADISWQQTDSYGDEPVADIRVRYAPLHGVDVSAEHVPLTIDEFPILFIASACASGQTHFRGVRELRYKESDRIAVMLEGLKALGIEGVADENNVCIQGGVLQGGIVSSYDDHRVAMAFAIAGSVAREPVKVLNCSAVSTSFPQFMAAAHQIYLHIEEYHDEP